MRVIIEIPDTQREPFEFVTWRGEIGPGTSLNMDGDFKVLAVLDDEFVLARQTCSECGGTLGSCFQSKLKCCPDCAHFPAGTSEPHFSRWLAGEES